MNKLVILAAALIASVALAATVRLDAQVFRGGFWSGSVASRASGNRVTGMYESSATIDFASATTTCADSTAITVTGAAVGDPCAVGYDGATVNAANSSFSCYVSAADAVKVRHCAAGTASDPTSATFRVRVISSR